MKKLLTVFAASGLIAACGGTKKETPTQKTTAICPTSTVIIKRDTNLKSAKMITDGGSIDDKSFNNSIWDGVKKYVGTGSNNYIIPTASNAKDRQTVYKKALSDTQLLVLGGYQHKDALEAFCGSIEANRGIVYIDGIVESGNINSITFKTQEAAFYAGYLSAKYLSDNKTDFDVKGSEGLKVGTYGGMDIQPVTAFMGGFQQGVEFWNANIKDDQSKVEFIKLGSSAESYFSGNFRAGGGKAISEKLVNKGADMILPVAGPQTLDTLKVVEEKGAITLVIGVDTDQVTQYKGHEDRFFTSILKKMDIASYNAIQVILGDKEDKDYGLGKVTEGTMANELLGLANSGDNKMANSEYEFAKEDSKISAAAEKATDTFNA